MVDARKSNYRQIVYSRFWLYMCMGTARSLSDPEGNFHIVKGVLRKQMLVYYEKHACF